MKHNIVLIIDGVSSFHDSTEAAIEHSNDRKYDDAKIAHIYAYQMTARKGGFRWNSDKPKVVRKVPAEKRFMKRWTDIEKNLLIKAKKDGKTYAEIAQVLNRTAKSVELRWHNVKSNA